jgi:hypothetical protein
LEVIGRFVQHILPPGFHRVRSFGWLHPARRVRLNRVDVEAQLQPVRCCLVPQQRRISPPGRLLRGPLPTKPSHPGPSPQPSTSRPWSFCFVAQSPNHPKADTFCNGSRGSTALCNFANRFDEFLPRTRVLNRRAGPHRALSLLGAVLGENRLCRKRIAQERDDESILRAVGGLFTGYDAR